MLGNVVTGCSVLAPAGMLGELSSGLDVSIRTAGLLITFGAIVLCVGSPVTAWLTSRIERRTLLTVTIAVLALGNFASAVAPGWSVTRSKLPARRSRSRRGSAKAGSARRSIGCFRCSVPVRR
jgi:predicted MFS family arabinose efflux permease